MVVSPRERVGSVTLRADRPEERATAWSVLGFVVQYRRAAALGAVLGAALGLAVAFATPRYYRAEAQVVPQGGRLGNVSGIAAQLGIPIGGANAGDNAAYFAALVNSPSILGRIVADTFTVVEGGSQRRRTLVQLEEEKGTAPALAHKRAIDHLRRQLHVSVDATTNLLTVQVDQPQPIIAYQIASDVVSELNAFNVQTRRDRAEDERTFAEEQLDESRQALATAEARLRDFREANRALTASPALQLRAQELQRDALMRQAEYSSLEEAYQQARLESLRSSPVLTAIELPQIPPEPQSRHALLRLVVGLVIGAIVGLAIAAAALFRRTLRTLETSGAA